jgi:hypothetical protein
VLRRLVGLVISVAVTAAALGAARSSSAPAPLVIDQTLLCSTNTSGGLREVEVRANAGFRQGGPWKILAFATVATGGVRSAANVLDDSLAWVAAGKYDHNANLTPSNGLVLTNVTRFGTLALNRVVCKAAKTRVPLSAKGLGDAAPDALGVAYDCATPSRVLVRVRTIAHSTPTRYRDQQFEKTKASLQTGFLAMRTQAGKQRAFAAVFDSGKARLFVAESCEAD